MFTPKFIEKAPSLLQGINNFYKRQFDIALQRFSKLNLPIKNKQSSNNDVKND